MVKGKECASIGNGAFSETEKIICYTRNWNIAGCEQKFNLIDTPGLEDTRLNNRDGEKDNKTLSMLNQVLNKFKGQIHLVIPVIGKEALTPSYVQ
jgi:hypothetical protein